MKSEKAPESDVKISGVGTHRIDVDMLDESVRERVIACIRKNGKISIDLGGRIGADASTRGFEQLID